MKNTKIEWCDSTWNPVTGCYHDCEYCYARNIANRFKGCIDEQSAEEVGNGIYYVKHSKLRETKRHEIVRAHFPYGFAPTFHEYRLKDIRAKGYGETVFVCSTADLFGEWVPDEWITKVFDACIEANKKLKDKRYLFLTKNPRRYIDLANRHLLPEEEYMWYGTTVTKPEEPYFYNTDRHTFVSVEPIRDMFLVDDIHRGFNNTDWVIFGAETGNNRHKVTPLRCWIEGAVEKLQENKTPVFMKNSLKDIWGEELLTQFPWTQ